MRRLDDFGYSRNEMQFYLLESVKSISKRASRLEEIWPNGVVLAVLLPPFDKNRSDSVVEVKHTSLCQSK